MHRLLIPSLLALALLPAPAAAETTDCMAITSLPATLSSQGIYCLTGNLATSLASGSAITIANNNVTIDCNGYKIGGLAAGQFTQATGILASGRSNITIRNCGVRGFRTGIRLMSMDSASDTGHVVEDNRLDGNTYEGIVVFAGASVVRRNLVTDTGGADSFYPTAIWGTFGVDIIGNTVDGVADPLGFATMVIGIRVELSRAASVSGNRVRNILSDSQGIAYHEVGNPFGNVFRGNIAASPGGTGQAIAFDCGGQGSPAIDNVSVGYSDPIVGCLDGGGNRELP